VTKDEIKNKEDFINYILIQLYEKVHPVDFGNFFMEVSPTGGIDSFRNLLDELTENKLLVKQSTPNGSVPGMPWLNTLDLRYGISLSGITYLKNDGLLGSKKQMKDIVNDQSLEKEVFVTYSWDSEEHNERVISFTNYLRDEGFVAEMDKMHLQGATATDFNKMMHQAITDYKKVIVVLSRGYKEKAEKFRGGVGNEYSLILKDMEANPKKYILVSFEGINDEITPLYFKGRHIIDLSDRKHLNELFAKLKDEDIIEFSPVGEKKPSIEKKKIAKFNIPDKKLEVINLSANANNSSQLGQLYDYIEFDLSLELKNDSQEAISNYNIEVVYPINSTGFEVVGRIEDRRKIVTYDVNPQIFASQKRTIKIESITVRENNVKYLLDASILIKIYTENGTTERKYALSEILKLRNGYTEQSLTSDMFR